MPDVIYPRLFLEVIPEELKQNRPDIKKLLNGKHNSHELKSHFGKLISSVYEYNPNSNIGLEFGSYLQPPTLCDLSQAIMSSNNLNSAFGVIEKAFHTHDASYYPSIFLDDGLFSLSLTFPFKDTVSVYQKRFCVETAYSFIVNMIRHSIDPGFTPLRVSCNFPKPAYAKEYPEIFGHNIVFNAPINLIEIDEACLFKQLDTSNPTVNKMYLRKSIEDWQTNRDQVDFEQMATTFMLKHHPHAFSCQSLANLMNLSVRGLQKKLSKHDVTFSQVTNRARKTLTEIYLLQEKRSINWTADKLGFQSRSGFARFFKIEFDQTPAEFIREHVEP